MPCLVGKLPHELDIDDFDDGVVNSMPLTDWLALWLGGWGDDVVASAEASALKEASKYVGFDEDELTLREVEEMLSAQQRYGIWCTLFEIDS